MSREVEVEFVVASDASSDSLEALAVSFFASFVL